MRRQHPANFGVRHSKLRLFDSHQIGVYLSFFTKQVILFAHDVVQHQRTHIHQQRGDEAIFLMLAQQSTRDDACRASAPYMLAASTPGD